MTAKELIKELQEIITTEGRDYPIVIWTGFGRDETHELDFVFLVETVEDHISL